MKKIVFIVGGYYPNYSAVGRCIGNIADVADQNYDVTIISMKTEKKQSLNDSYRTQRIMRITTPHNSKYININYEMKKKPSIVNKIKKTMIRIEGIVDILSPGGSISKNLVNEYLKKLLSLDNNIDVIIPTCLSFETVLASLEYKKKNPRVIVMPYIFDLFAANKRLNRGWFFMKIKKKANLALEHRMFVESDFIYYVSNWATHINEFYLGFNNKCEEVEHPLLIGNIANCISEKYFADDKIHIIYTGSVDIHNRNPEWVLSLLGNLCCSQNYVFDFYSTGSAESIIEKYARLYVNIVAHGLVPSTQIALIRNESSFWISIGNSDCSQTPSKIIEYIATGKPIIHFAVTKKDPAIKILCKYDNAIVVFKDDILAASKIEKFLQSNFKKQLDNDVICKIFEDFSPGFIWAELEKSIKSCFRQNGIGGGVRLVFAGALLKNYVDAEYLMKLWDDICMQDFFIDFYSSGSGTNVIKKTKLNNIKLFGWVEFSKLEKIMKSADCFMSISEKTGTKISSKIFQYMSYQKPIIHIYYHDDDVNLKYLRKYPLSLCIKASVSTIMVQRYKIIIFLLNNIGLTSNHDMLLLKECTPNAVFEKIEKNVRRFKVMEK